MKNPYINRTRISARQFRKFLALFCKDFNAIQIADLMHWNCNTANLWINLIRQRILTLVEQEKLANATNVQLDETYFTRTKEYFPKYGWPHEEICVFGCIDDTGIVYATIMPKPQLIYVLPIIQTCCESGETIYTDSAALYKELYKLGYKHCSVNHRDLEFSRHENNECITTNRIEVFWGWLKTRLGKFRGVKWDNLEVYIAESVWRYNHKKDDIYKLLLGEFRRKKLS